jgi:diamine N-acetyltransferase
MRLLEERDLPLTLEWRNREENRQWFFSSDPIAPEQHRRWFERYKEKDDDFVFVIEELESLKRPVGQLSLYDIDWAAGRAEFGRLLIGDPEAHGLKLAQLATTGLTDEALAGWGLREIMVYCRESNTRAIRVCAASGFEIVGTADQVTTMIRRQRDGRDDRGAHG